jgi:DNA-binding PadR family transcriptional regulator
MRPTDDRILELIRDHGHLTPQAVENAGGPSAGHTQNRLRALRQYGMVKYYLDTRGLYSLTEEGRAYLDEELDASTLTPNE